MSIGKVKNLPENILERVDEVLEHEEKIIEFMKEPWSYYKWHRWTILTDRRILIVKHTPFNDSMWTFIKLIDLVLDTKEGWVFDSIYISYFDHKFNLQFFSWHRDETRNFFHRIRDQIEIINEGSSKSSEVVHELEGLAQVFYEKIISKEEYDKKKKELIKRL